MGKTPKQLTAALKLVERVTFDVFEAWGRRHYLAQSLEILARQAASQLEGTSAADDAWAWYRQVHEMIQARVRGTLKGTGEAIRLDRLKKRIGQLVSGELEGMAA